MKFKHFLLIFIFGLGIFIRFYNYENRVTFGPEQAVSLITSGRMITEKISFLGEQNMQRATSSGHYLFAGALFSYSLIPFQLLFNFDALSITFYFTILNLFTALVLFFVARHMIDETAAVYTVILFLFSSISIYHSLFIWDQNYSFLIGTLTIYLLFLLKKEYRLKYVFFLGLISGIAYSIQDLYAFTALMVFVLILVFTGKKMLAGALFILGAMLANVSTILFDLRNGLYYLKTSIEYVTDFVKGNNINVSLDYYHLLIFFPGFFLVGGYFISKLHKKSIFYGVLVVCIYIIVNLKSDRIDLSSPTGMPADLTVKNIYNAATIIVDDKPDEFNVAVLVDYDTRGHVLRYPLEFKYKLKPLDIVKYPEAETVYVLAQENYDFLKSKVWELSDCNKNNVVNLAKIGSNYSVFKLEKQ